MKKELTFDLGGESGNIVQLTHYCGCNFQKLKTMWGKKRLTKKQTRNYRQQTDSYQQEMGEGWARWGTASKETFVGHLGGSVG